jgi:hypothetical protein
VKRVDMSADYPHAARGLPADIAVAHRQSSVANRPNSTPGLLCARAGVPPGDSRVRPVEVGEEIVGLDAVQRAGGHLGAQVHGRRGVEGVHLRAAAWWGGGVDTCRRMNRQRAQALTRPSRFT